MKRKIYLLMSTLCLAFGVVAHVYASPYEYGDEIAMSPTLNLYSFPGYYPLIVGMSLFLFTLVLVVLLVIVKRWIIKEKRIKDRTDISKKRFGIDEGLEKSSSLIKIFYFLVLLFVFDILVLFFSYIFSDKIFMPPHSAFGNIISNNCLYYAFFNGLNCADLYQSYTHRVLLSFYVFQSVIVLCISAYGAWLYFFRKQKAGIFLVILSFLLFFIALIAGAILLDFLIKIFDIEKITSVIPYFISEMHQKGILYYIRESFLL